MIALIDGDVLCYQACKPRWQSKVDDIGIVSLDDNGNRAQLNFTMAEDVMYTEESWQNLQKDLKEMLDNLYCEHYLMVVKGGDSFRDIMYPIELNEEHSKAIWGYKANRWKPEGERNKIVPELRRRCVESGLAIYAEDREADDYLRIWANEAIAVGDPYVICSIDKDLRCIPGNHWIMNKLVKEKFIKISEEAAARHYYEQLLKGDPTDNIPGVPRVGEVKAAKFLAKLSTQEEFQAAVVEKYIEAYDTEWRDFLLSNGKMIHLQRHMNDYFSLEDWPIVKELSAL